jgi:hypothetical protein
MRFHSNCCQSNCHNDKGPIKNKQDIVKLLNFEAALYTGNCLIIFSNFIPTAKLKAAISDDDPRRHRVHRAVLQGPQLPAVKHQQHDQEISALLKATCCYRSATKDNSVKKRHLVYLYGIPCIWTERQLFGYAFCYLSYPKS